METLIIMVKLTMIKNGLKKNKTTILTVKKAYDLYVLRTSLFPIVVFPK